MVNLCRICRECVGNLCQVPTAFSVWRIKSMKNMKIGLKWVHMARYGLILKLERALWLTIIFRPLLTPKGAIKIPKNPKKVLKSVPNQPSAWSEPECGYQMKQSVFYDQKTIFQKRVAQKTWMSQLLQPFSKLALKISLTKTSCQERLRYPGQGTW